jgi:hypothetical protein
MKSMDLWKELKVLEGQELETLRLKKRFTVENVNPHKGIILYLSSTEKNRYIQAVEIESPFQELELKHTITRTKIQQEYSAVKSAYVATLRLNK